MSLVARLDQNFHYIGVGGVVSVAAGIVLSSLLLKVIGVGLLALGLIGYVHQKFFVSNHRREAVPAAPVINVINGPQPPPNLANITIKIDSEDQIPGLTNINGLSIEEIEKRARPAKHPSGPNQTVDNAGRSFSGFLGMDESFKQVLLADWKTVRVLGWTHKDLARHLNAISEIAQHGPHLQSQEITYDYSGTGNATQNLRVFYALHRGTQEDIFTLDARPGDSSGWNGQCLITNLSTNASVMWTPGVEMYIQKYGFYEGGGKQNQYRVDPVALISVLTGGSEESLRKKSVI